VRQQTPCGGSWGEQNNRFAGTLPAQTHEDEQTNRWLAGGAPRRGTAIAASQGLASRETLVLKKSKSSAERFTVAILFAYPYYGAA